MRTAVLRYVPRAFSAATLEDVLRPLLCAFATPTLRVVLGWAVLRYGPCAFSATTLEAVLRSVLCALPVPTLRVVLRRAVLRYVSRAFSAATLGLGASFMVVPHGRYVAGAPRSLEAVGGLGTRRFQRHLSRRLSRAHSRSSTGSVTPSLASVQSF